MGNDPGSSGSAKSRPQLPEFGQLGGFGTVAIAYRLLEGPLAYRAYVYVDELGFGVVADSAGAEGEGGLAKVFGRDAGNADVDGFGQHVLAVFGDSRGAGAEIVVAPRGAIAANDVDDCVGTVQPGEQIMKQVEFARIVVADISGAVVAQEVVEHLDGRRDIPVSDAINNVDRLAGVQVVHLEAVLFPSWGGCLGVQGGRRRRCGAAECADQSEEPEFRGK